MQLDSAAEAEIARLLKCDVKESDLLELLRSVQRPTSIGRSRESDMSCVTFCFASLSSPDRPANLAPDQDYLGGETLAGLARLMFAFSQTWKRHYPCPRRSGASAGWQEAI